MLYAAKAAAGTSGVDRSTRDITTLLNEINRPLGLMERWELEENEPLSRRRDRLQGRDPAAELHLDSVHKRMSRLTLNPGGIGARTQSRLMLPLQPPQPVPESIAGEDHAASEAAADPDPPEIEGETLAERRRRLQAETLPRPRPVSTTFSSELLSQFGDRDDEDENTKPADHGRAKHAKTASRGSVDAEPQEEQETLGQRRRRLQAEREAREREMGSGGGGRGGGGLLSPDLPGRSGTPMGLHSNAVAGSRSLVGMPPYPGGPSPHDEANRLSRRLSMADILNAHPREAPQGNLHPLERERLRREAEAARAQQEQERKMAALRAQMPQTLTTPAVGAAKGGYMGGRFNDGQGGGFGRGVGYAVPQQQQQQRLSTHPAGVSGVGGGTVHGAAAPHPYGVGVAAPLYGGGVPSPGGYGINGAYSGFGGVPMSGQPTQGQLDMVERWRQSVMP
ncbi:hypothetical protein VTK73DRAFT_5052 [Phialemonium thermophilum]|uniref:Uncharacterized protein n=1 Tax=Phialemonium thermophilum TaxID=223376 RepID=A0ABR3V423_9PEZI